MTDDTENVRVVPQDDKSITKADSIAAEAEETVETSSYPGGWRLALITLALCLGNFLIAIDNTIISVAIPKITAVFSSIHDIGWYGSAYLLTITSFQPSFGKLYKISNTKLTYLACIIVFEVGSVLCAAAPNSVVFILGRAIAGLGAAGLFQGALQILTLSVALEKRPLFMGIVVSVFGIAICFGPVLGGFFTDHVTWRWCFWINLPIGGLCLLLVFLFLKLGPRRSLDRKLTLGVVVREMDPPGALLIIASVCCLLLALQWGGAEHPWSSSRIIGLFVGFGLLLLLFTVVQWKSGENATIPLRVLRQRSVISGALFLFFLQMTNFIGSYYIPFYFQATKGVSAMTSGIQYFPYALSQIVAVIITGAIVSKTGYYVPYMVVGAIIGALGTGLLTRINVDTKTVEWAAYLVVSGLGIGIGMQIPFTALQVVLTEEDVAVGNSISLFFSQLGAAISVSAGQTIFVNSLVSEVQKRTPGISPADVLAIGATNIGSLSTSAAIVRNIRDAYSSATTKTLTLALVAVCVTVPLAMLMEWKNLKKVAAGRQETAPRSDPENTEKS
ncbi:major facilitator superfamily domain-containing protein [Tricladium varicosporioides]|nr:major facilitator superfamily domain-containing protein [Hymenoscyphus varicosporioides]